MLYKSKVRFLPRGGTKAAAHSREQENEKKAKCCRRRRAADKMEGERECRAAGRRLQPGLGNKAEVLQRPALCWGDPAHPQAQGLRGAGQIDGREGTATARQRGACWALRAAALFLPSGWNPLYSPTYPFNASAGRSFH